MSKINKKSSKSQSETDSTSDDSSCESKTEEQDEKRSKKRNKDKKKQHKHKKKSSKKSKHKSESEKEDSDDGSSSEPSPKREKKSRSRERDKQSLRSKWESPPRRRNSNSRGRNRSRSRSRQRDRSRDHQRPTNRDQKDRFDVKRERDDRRDFRHDSGEHRSNNYQRRERSPQRDRNYIKREQRSPPRRDRGSDNNRFKNRRRGEGDDKNYEWGKRSDDKNPEVKSEEPPKEKEKPDFGLSGALTEDTNKVNGVVIKYSEPLEARKPKRRWRLYPFKGETALPVLHIHRQSCFLVGRDRKVVDLAVDHPSCSKQHAALQYRLVPFEREDGTTGKRVRLYLIDLDSANGTFLNNKRIDARKYYELMEKDVVKFGFSTREYVLLHENSKEDQEDDDIEVKDEPMENQ